MSNIRSIGLGDMTAIDDPAEEAGFHPGDPIPPLCVYGDRAPAAPAFGLHRWTGVGVVQVNVGGQLAQQVIPAILMSCACGAVRGVAVQSITGAAA